MKVRTKSAKVNKAWLSDHVNDPYVRLARKEGYRARAAYKLKEIDESLNLLKPGQLVVDPFVGSGTTAVVAARLGRRWRAGDADARYVGLARERISQTR